MAQCPQCGQSTGPEDRFCRRCGAAAQPLCSQCGRELSADMAFCPGCGTPVSRRGATGATPLPPDQHRHEDRRRVSVLFIDVVNFTGFVERSDPERVRSMQTSFFAAVRRVVGKYNGLVEKYIGDAVMALFGAPVTTENQVIGAVSAALELRRTLRRDGGHGGTPVGFRIGVATGEALVDTVAARDGGQAIAAGDVINTASRLQSAAPDNGVLVDGPTHAATENSFRYQGMEPVILRGHTQPTQVWVPVAPLRRRLTDRDIDDTPLVNRAHERQLLTSALDRMVAERSPQLVTIFGRAGIGKSRLVRELFRYSEERPELMVRWRTGHCPPFGENVTYAAFADIVKAEAGLLDSDDADTARQRLHAAVARLVPPADADRLAYALGPLVGLPGQQVAKETESAWRRFVVAMASQRPTVLVVEDLHWADQTMVHFVERLGSVVRDVPLLVICTSRPELLDREPVWAAAVAGSQTISLSAMNDKHIADMYAALFGRTMFPPDVLDRLVELAGGNPLYAHEYFRMLLDQGTLRRPEVAAGAVDDHAIPDNVHAVIANRLDLLDADDRAVLQAASVLGVAFWPDAVAYTLGLPTPAVERALRRMEQRELVCEQSESARDGQEEYRFSHVLVRDVCYQRLPRTVRVQRHVRVADWFEATVGDSRATDVSEVVANHRFWAHEIARTLRMDTAPYAAPARTALRHAARRAYALHAPDIAVDHVQRALRLFGDGEDADTERYELELLDAELAFLKDPDTFLTDGGPDRLMRLALAFENAVDREAAARAWALHGQVAWVRADRQVAAVSIGRAIEYFAPLPDSEAKAGTHALLARLYLTADDHPETVAAAGTAAGIAARLDLADVHANAMITIGTSRYLTGDVTGIAVLEEALDTCRRLDLPSLRRAAKNLSSCVEEEGEIDRAAALQREGELGRIDDSRSVPLNDGITAHHMFLVGDWKATLAANDALRAAPSGAWAVHPRIQSVWLRTLRGEGTGTDDEEIAEVRRLGEQAGFVRLEWVVLAHAALCHALRDRPERATDLLGELTRRWRPVGTVPSGSWVAAAGHAAALAGAVAGTRLSDMLADAPRATPWVRAARAAAAGDAERAAEEYRRIGAHSDEALSLAIAARFHRVAGRPEQAEAYLRELRPFVAANGAGRLLEL